MLKIKFTKDLGGKANNLQLLSQWGLPVPAWFVLTHAELTAANSRATYCSLEQQIFQKISDSRIPFATRYFAVRSSANIEDSQQSSFAGIFESLLYVERDDLVKAVLEVWSSFQSSRAKAYCEKLNIDVKTIEMNVIVQEMIDSDRSGVLFQANPSGNINEMLISAGFGLGQGIVDGQVETDTYIFQEGKLTSETLGEKKAALFYIPANKQCELISLPDSQAQGNVLTPKDLQRLQEISQILSQNCEHYQDIEWTISRDRKLFILQTRPITTLPPKKYAALFDCSNIAENYPGITLPLSYSILKRGYAANFKNLLRWSRLSDGVLKDMNFCLDHLVGHWGGRIYYQMNHWYRILNLLPFGHKFAQKSFNEMIGSQNTLLFDRPARGFYRDLNNLVRMIPFALFYLLFPSLLQKHYQRTFNPLYRKTREKIRLAQEPGELMEIYAQADREYTSIAFIGLLNDFFSSLFMSFTKTVLTKLEGPAPDSTLLSDLFCHQQEAESTKAVYSLLELSERTARSPEVEGFLQNYREAANPDSLKTHPHPEVRDFLVQLNRHLDLYGDRGHLEMKLEQISTREDPTSFIQRILTTSKEKTNRRLQSEKESRKLQSAKEKLNQLTRKKPFWGILFQLIYGKTRDFIIYRENSRFDRVRIKGVVRDIFLKMGKKLAQYKILQEGNDIFYLYYHEIPELFTCGVDYQIIRDSLSRRKQEFAKYRDFTLPERFLASSPLDFEKLLLRSSRGGSEGDLRGICCSSGTVEGECVVVKEGEEVGDCRGKIVIAQSTDPSWGYALFGMTGLVIERGSLLSHTAIIAREMGIPTVVGMRGASSRLSTGMRLRLVADKGTVEIL